MIDSDCKPHDLLTAQDNNPIKPFNGNAVSALTDLFRQFEAGGPSCKQHWHTSLSSWWWANTEQLVTLSFISANFWANYLVLQSPNAPLSKILQLEALKPELKDPEMLLEQRETENCMWVHQDRSFDPLLVQKSLIIDPLCLSWSYPNQSNNVVHESGH